MRWTVEVSVADSGVRLGFGRRLRRFALRLAVGAGLAALVWLLSAAASAGTASAAQHPHGVSPSDRVPAGTNSGGLLGGLLGGLGNTLSGTLSGVTNTVSAVTSTVSSLTTGVVGGLVDDVVGTLQTTLTDVVAPITTGLTGTSGGGTQAGSGGGTETTPVVVKAPAEHQTAAVPVVVPPSVPPAASPVVLRHVTTSVAPQRVLEITAPMAPTLSAPRVPSRPLPDPAPQPAPIPVVPASFVSAGHGCHGPARHLLGASSSDTFVPFLAAFGVDSSDLAAIAGRSQGLPPTTPD